MKQIFLAPRSNETAYKNYISSMQGKRLDDLAPYLTPDEVKILEGDDRYFVWGCQPGLRGRWEEMQHGDYVIFYSHGRFVSVGTLKFKKHSEDLALSLWPASKVSGEPWSCVFFVENVQEISLSLDQFNLDTGYHFRAIMGFMRVSKEEAINNLLSTFGSLDNYVRSLTSGIDMSVAGEIADISAKSPSDLTDEDKAKLDTLTRDRSPEEIEFALQLYTERQLGKKPEQITKITKSYKRNVGMVKALKEKFQNKCQICGFTFRTAKGHYYSEAAHVIPISKGSEGVDSPDNIWILCANHHKMLDRDTIKAVGPDVYELDGELHKLLQC